DRTEGLRPPEIANGAIRGQRRFVAQRFWVPTYRDNWRRARDSNPQGPRGPVDFKSTALPVEASPPCGDTTSTYDTPSLALSALAYDSHVRRRLLLACIAASLLAAWYAPAAEATSVGPFLLAHST